MLKLSKWQDGTPPIDGVYEIYVPEQNRIYAARFKNGLWDAGNDLKKKLVQKVHEPYPLNNDPANPRKWRGVIDE